MINKNKHSGLYEATCDHCSDAHLEIEADDFKSAVDEIKKQGWYVFKDDIANEWVHHCADCGLSSKKKKRKRVPKEPKRKEEISKRPIRAYELQHREAALLELLQSHPTQVIRGLAKQPEAEWQFGRLYLVGVINRDQYEAARYLDRVTRDYEMLLRRYGNVQASTFTKTDAPTKEDLSQTAQKRFAKAKKRYDEVYDLLNQCGYDVKKVIVDTLRKDEKPDLEPIQRGLTVLATGLFVTGRRKRGRRTR